MSAEAPPVRVDARNTRPGAPGSRPGLLAPPWGRRPRGGWEAAGSRAAGRGALREVAPGLGREGVSRGTREGPTYTLSSLAASYTPTVMVR